MKKDFKKAGYWLAILVFFLGIAALLISSIVNYFAYDEIVVITGQIVSFIAFILLMVICVFAKKDYNYVCTKFADYILGNRRKEAEHQATEAEHLKQIQNMKSAADHEREDAIAAAFEQGRNEGAHAALQSVANRPQQNPQSISQPAPQIQPPVMPQPQPRSAPTYMQPIMPNDEILYNEYGEPVMIRRRVRKTREHYDGDVLYDRYGNPVARRAQNLWEIGGQKIQVSNQPDPPAEIPQTQQSSQAQPMTPPKQAPQSQPTVQPQQTSQVQPTAQPQQDSQPQPIVQPQQAPQVQQSPQTQQALQPQQVFQRQAPADTSEPFRYF